MLVSNVKCSYLKNGVWSSFSDQAENTMDGIKIQTNPNSAYYLQYRTWNEGRPGYYDYVKSTQDDFAGMSGRPIQRLQIQVYKNDGTKLTSGVVVMYRVKNGSEWIPWVSNADPEWMRSVQQKYNLGGTLAVDSVYAGNPGVNITGVQILVYEEGSLGDFTGGEVSASLSYMVGNLSNWSPFSQGALAPQMDGIKIQTSASKDYYLLYKTWNAGNSSYYPTVKSTEDDYAGYPGKAIQRLAIQVFRNDGTKLTSGVIVMYRVFAEGEWLPWVSNADPEWMHNAQNKYSLGGTLDVDSVYAGNAGQNISGVEIRIFEDDSYNAGSDSFSGSEINLNLSYMSDSLSNWTPFSRSVVSSDIDGIKIQTDSSQPFYLQYKSWNEGRTSYYPVVDSRGTAYNDYAGYPGQTMQLLSITAHSSDGTKLTSGVVVMYRVRVAGVWLPWVSNADPEWMQSVFRQYNLDGTLDTVSTYAGNKGQNIDGVEIRAFTGTTNNNPVGNLSGTEYVPSLSYMNDSLSNWTPFSGSVITSKLDGIKIQTDPSKPYYLVYKSWNAGKSGYYPDVKSTGTAYNDYAGYPGQPTQLLSIKAYRNDGVKLTTGVVVMYRVHIGDSWIPWVSNADPEWMRSVQNKYGLGGVLDYDAYYAGNKGQNINGIEIRIFEENGISDAPPTPSGPHKIIQAPFISQLGRYPTGCESVSSVMALNYAGYDISVDTFIDQYLDKRPWPFDPNETFGGNPRLTSGWGCYTPVIRKAMDKILEGKHHSAKVVNGMSIPDLCSTYIDKDIPVIFWGTIDMAPPHPGKTWTYNGKSITWIAPLHCLLLVGYDDNHYIFNDPLKTNAPTYYSKEAVELAYNGISKQAMVLVENPYKYIQPAIPDVPAGTPSILNFISDIRQLETIYTEWPGFILLDPRSFVEEITKLFRGQEYTGFQWDVTTSPVNYAFTDYIKSNHPDLWNRFYNYIKKETNGHRSLMSDGRKGRIDFAHLMATLEGYQSKALVPHFWAGWGGDLATGMRDTTYNIKENTDPGELYYGKTVQQIADATIGNESLTCNYTDFCSDFDAYKIAQKILEYYENAPHTGWNIHIVSDTIQWYYTTYANTLYTKRFEWITEELNCDPTFESLTAAIYKTMNSDLEELGLLKLLAGDPTDKVNIACCRAFAHYIYTMIHTYNS